MQILKMRVLQVCFDGLFFFSNIVNSLMELLLIQMKEPVKFMESLVQVPLVGLL